MAEISRRQFARFSCNVPVELFPAGSRTRLGEAMFLDLSVGGALLETAIPLERGVAYDFRISWNKAFHRLGGRVAWEIGSGPKAKTRKYGISFNLTTDQEKQLRVMIDALRRDGEPKQGRSLKDYWNS